MKPNNNHSHSFVYARYALIPTFSQWEKEFIDLRQWCEEAMI